MQRATIRDIAEAAGVSLGAVSFALNNKPGVSAATRERILKIAADLGWTPNAAARALSASRANAVGLVIARSRESVSAESFFFQLICGVEQILTTSSLAFVLQIVETQAEELQVYRDWWAQGRVDGVLLVDLRAADPRPELLGKLGLPFAAVGAKLPGGGAVIVDEEGLVASILTHLQEEGCKVIAYVGGLATLQHGLRRREAMQLVARGLGLRMMLSGDTDYTELSAVRETERLLAANPRPDAIVYENEILALGGLKVIKAANLRLPRDVAVVSCEDSPICRVADPPLTALRRDPAELGASAAELLVAALQTQSEVGERIFPVPTLEVRASTHRRSR